MCTMCHIFFSAIGSKGELYYVRNNIVNENALLYTIPLPANIFIIYLNWQNNQITEQVSNNKILSQMITGMYQLLENVISTLCV